MRDLFRRRRGAPGAAEQSSVVLSDRQHELVDEELAILTRLGVLLDEYPATEEDRHQIGDAKDQLTSLFMLVVVGEFNAGKSAFINALIGGQILPEGVTPTTSVINILTYGERTGERRLGDGEVGVAGLDLRRLGTEQRGVEGDRRVEVIDVEGELEAGHQVS